LPPCARVTAANGRSQSGALGISARAWLSGTGGDRIVPFFLMPTLGGGNYLRGYATYRFRERNAVLLRAEYCWAVHKMVDVAGLYEATGGVEKSSGGVCARAPGLGERIAYQLCKRPRLDRHHLRLIPLPRPSVIASLAAA